MSWDNDTDAAQTYALSYTTELKITSGAEVTNSVSIGSEFEGLSVSMDASVKTFSTAETTNAKTKTVTVNVPPHKKVTFYQRRYDFRSTMFFVLDAWREEWNAGSEGGYAITRKNCTVQIYSEDYLTSETELSDSATGTMNVKTVSRFYHEGDRKTRKRENLTTRAKDVLDSMGV
ncbi:hypothetical protein C8Q77DRAFT_576665 [Trametes polyzona]|nr:hypothetical protein C8Q77DRAFT_576665 [Trametes polyzona]